MLRAQRNPRKLGLRRMPKRELDSFLYSSLIDQLLGMQLYEEVCAA